MGFVLQELLETKAQQLLRIVGIIVAFDTSIKGTHSVPRSRIS